MAISEARLRDALLVMIDQQNKRGGLLGRPLEAVVLEPASQWPMYGEKARQLIEREKVAVIFGCWTSASRKEVKAAVEELNGLLFYPVQYEGREQSPNIFYLGAAPNQQALPAVRYLLEERNIQRWVLAGTDYVYPRTTNRMLAAYLADRGVSPEDIMLSYTPFGHTDWGRIVSDIKQFGSQGRKTAVISTINGDANGAFYRELAAQGVSADSIPVLAFSIGEAELQSMDVASMVGHLAAWNYFMSLDNPANRAFLSDLQAFSSNPGAVGTDPLEAQAIGFQLWVAATEHAQTVEPAEVRKALPGLEVANLSGGRAKMHSNHHLSKPVYIGQIRPDGQYDVIWQSNGSVTGDPWFDPVSAHTEEERQ
jgi:urea transport system substrate-binding protein